MAHDQAPVVCRHRNRRTGPGVHAGNHHQVERENKKGSIGNHKETFSDSTVFQSSPSLSSPLNALLKAILHNLGSFFYFLFLMVKTMD